MTKHFLCCFVCINVARVFTVPFLSNCLSFNFIILISALMLQYSLLKTALPEYPIGVLPVFIHFLGIEMKKVVGDSTARYVMCRWYLLPFGSRSVP